MLDASMFKQTLAAQSFKSFLKITCKALEAVAVFGRVSASIGSTGLCSTQSVVSKKRLYAHSISLNVRLLTPRY